MDFTQAVEKAVLMMGLANAFKGQADGSSTKFYFRERYFCGAAYRLRGISNICCVASSVQLYT